VIPEEKKVLNCSFVIKMMKSQEELSIIIPAHNEEKYLGELLESILKQTIDLAKIKIFILISPNTTDQTRKIALSYQKKLNITILPGGLPSAARNKGAKKAKTTYLLFLDADIVLGNSTLIKDALTKMKKKHWVCTTCDIRCKGDSRASFIYSMNNAIQHLSKFKEPFATGMFMLFERKKFWSLGGFDEKILYAEDYALTKKVARKQFGIVSGYIYAPNRRFKKMGYVKIARMFLKTAVNVHNKEYFLKKEHAEYWR
jgi:glycosyltransferase involved in cell wall biosynthesis